MREDSGYFPNIPESCTLASLYLCCLPPRPHPPEWARPPHALRPRARKGSDVARASCGTKPFQSLQLPSLPWAVAALGASLAGSLPLCGEPETPQPQADPGDGERPLLQGCGPNPAPAALPTDETLSGNPSLGTRPTHSSWRPHDQCCFRTLTRGMVSYTNMKDR